MVNDSDINEDDDYKKYDSYTVFNSYKTHLVLLLFFVLFVFIVIFSLLGNQPIMESARPWMFAIEIVLWIILITIIVLNIKTIKSGDIDFTQQLLNLIGYDDPEIKINVHKDEEIKEDDEEKEDKKECEVIDRSKDYWFKDTKTSQSSQSVTSKSDEEVFHIPQNIYTYDDAEKTCKLLNSRLATYEEIERAYQNGGNWCSYGWSSDQLALFPTQKEIYNELKKIPGHERDCGRPGINGGYFKNKNMKFGINCYGKKPYITTKDKEYIKNHSYTSAINNISEEKKKLTEKQIENILVAPFNKSAWSSLQS
jgi:Extracellular link domain